MTSKIRKNWVLFFLTFSLLSLPAFSAEDGLPSKGGKKSDPVSALACQKLLQRKAQFAITVLNVIEKFIEDNYRFPTETEFAESIGYGPDDLKTYYETKGSPKDYPAVVARFKNLRTGALRQLRAAEVKWVSKQLADSLRVPSTEDLMARHKQVEGLKGYTEVFGDPEGIIDEALGQDSDNSRRARTKVAKAYAKLAKQLERLPYANELGEALGRPELDGIVKIEDGGAEESDDESKYLFKDFSEIKKLAKTLSPSSFANALDQDRFGTPEQRQKLEEAIQKRKRLIVTGAIAGLKVDPKMFAALQVYAKENDAEIVVVPINMITENLDPILMNTPGVHVLVDSVRLNSLLKIHDINITAKQVIADTGLDRLLRRGETLVYASPRIKVKTIATVDNMFQNSQLFSTGCLNRPFYRSSSHIGRRTDAIATSQHEMGALLLEKADPNAGGRAGAVVGNYHLRHLQWVKLPIPGDTPWTDEEEGFPDRDRYYTAAGSRPLQVEAVTLPDLHIASISPQVVATYANFIRIMKPKRIELHDFFDGDSINHHTEKEPLTLLQRAMKGEFDLFEELSQASSFINQLLAIDPNLEIVIVKSNHDDWLRKMIARGDYLLKQGGKNSAIAAELTPVCVSGAIMKDRTGNNLRFTKDPIEYALINGVLTDPLSGKRPFNVIDAPNRVRFLKTGESLKVGPEDKYWAMVEHGYHGDMGVHGARAGTNPSSNARSAGQIVSGHIHYQQMRADGGVSIGTSQPPRVDYTGGGYSGWGPSVAVATPYGQTEVYQFQDGDWFLEKDGESRVEGPGFFEPNFPVIIPNPRFLAGPNDAGYDQYSKDPSRKN